MFRVLCNTTDFYNLCHFSSKPSEYYDVLYMEDVREDCMLVCVCVLADDTFRPHDMPMILPTLRYT